MATLLTARCARGDEQADVLLASTADSATLATAIGTSGILLAWDAAKVPDLRTLAWLLALVLKVLRQTRYPHT